MPAIESTRTAARWTTRIVPIFLTAAVAFATYVVVARVCFDYLLYSVHDNGAAIAILVLYFVFLLLMVATYARTLYHANFNAGVVPLGPRAARARQGTKEESWMRRPYEAHDIEGRAYEAGPDEDPDSPGLESFYTRDAFVCEADGRPRWCSQCCNWKQDRVHHSSEIGRCVYRMDHYCPWAGGMIGENSFKFFVQFTTYTSLYCGVVLGATASTLRRQVHRGGSSDPFLLAAIVIAAFFGLFAFMMTFTSVRYLLYNMTNVDILSYRHKVYYLAVRVPRGTRSDRFGTIDYPLRTSEHGPGSGKEANNRLQLNGHGSDESADPTPARSRDDLATRTFAILPTNPGSNPWDLGFWRNWCEVMGTNPLDWLFPIRLSPCSKHEGPDGMYSMDRTLDALRTRYGLPAGPPSDESTVMEMRNLRS